MLSSNISDFIYKFCIILIVVNLILLLIPNSRIKKTITFIFSCIVILYSVTPFMKIAKNDEISFDEYSYEIELQDNYFSFEKNEKEKQIRDIVARGMQSYENYLENIEVLFKDNSIKIEKIKLYFDKKFIKEKDVHIVIIEDIKNNLSKTYLIKKEDIEIFYEQYEK